MDTSAHGDRGECVLPCGSEWRVQVVKWDPANLPGLPGNEEEAVVRGVDPVRPALAQHHAAGTQV